MSSYNTDSDDVESIASDISPIETRFDELVEDIRSVLGSSSGIDSDDVDVNDLMNLMRSYSSEESHWKEYALGDPSRNYTRNLVDEGNGKANILILVWSPGKGSLIHDHANAHCIMKILKGALVEDLYDWPNAEVTTAPHESANQTTHETTPDETAPESTMALRKTTVLSENDVAYMSDKIGLHRISNPDPDQVAVSLHLYTPPYAAKYGCSKFDEKTGKATHINMSEYYSKYGKRSEKGCAGHSC